MLKRERRPGTRTRPGACLRPLPHRAPAAGVATGRGRADARRAEGSGRARAALVRAAPSPPWRRRRRSRRWTRCASCRCSLSATALAQADRNRRGTYGRDGRGEVAEADLDGCGRGLRGGVHGRGEQHAEGLCEAGHGRRSVWMRQVGAAAQRVSYTPRGRLGCRTLRQRERVSMTSPAGHVSRRTRRRRARALTPRDGDDDRRRESGPHHRRVLRCVPQWPSRRGC